MEVSVKPSIRHESCTSSGRVVIVTTYHAVQSYQTQIIFSLRQSTIYSTKI